MFCPSGHRGEWTSLSVHDKKRSCNLLTALSDGQHLIPFSTPDWSDDCIVRADTRTADNSTTITAPTFANQSALPLVLPMPHDDGRPLCITYSYPDWRFERMLFKFVAPARHDSIRMRSLMRHWCLAWVRHLSPPVLSENETRTVAERAAFATTHIHYVMRSYTVKPMGTVSNARCSK